jgi:uncharacterized protein
MRIDFDRAKDSANRQRHGVSLALAVELEWDFAMVWLNARFDYEESRMCGLVPRGSALYYIAFVDRGDVRRIISLRKATRKEVRAYVKNS